MDILLIRHGPVSAEAGTCYGRRDVPPAEPLAPLAERLHGLLPGIDAVWTSPLQRCVRLAHLLSQRRGVGMHLDPRWQELDFGQWEGRRWDDIGRSHRKALDRWALDPLGFAAPGGETVQALHARVQAALNAVHAQARERGWHTVAVVTHGGPIRALLARAMGLAPTKINALDIPLGGVFPLRRVAGDDVFASQGGGQWQQSTLDEARNALDSLDDPWPS